MRLVRTFLALLPWVSGSVVVSIACLLLTRRLVPPEALRQSNDAVGNYLQTLSTIIAVLLAFVVYMVWSQFNETRAAVDREANEAMDLSRAIGGFPDAVRVPLEEKMRAYLDVVVDGEWEALARCDDAALKRGWHLLDEMWTALRGFEPATDGMTVLYGDALARLNDLGDLRTFRITSMHQRVPLALWILLYMGTITTVVSTYLLGVESLALHAFIAGSITAALSHLLYVVWDLDNCFKGHFCVHALPFQRVRDSLGNGQARPAESVVST